MEIQVNYIFYSNDEFAKKIKYTKKWNFINKAVSLKYLFYIIFMILFLNISNLDIHKKSFNIYNNCIIEIKIKGIGNQSILSDSYDNCPNEIYLNGQLIYTNNCHFINISSQENNETVINTINLYWDNIVDSFDSMFKDLQNIVEVQLIYSSSLISLLSFSINKMFYGCSSLISLDLSKFGSIRVKNMEYMLYGCSSLISLYLPISSKNSFLSITNMEYMFYGCSSLISLDLSNFDSSSVTNMEYMFCGCKSLSSLDLSKFNTEKVSTMRGIFSNCTNLTSINLLNFKTQSVVDLSYMFYNCNSLKSLNLKNFVTPKLTLRIKMFEYCDSLIFLDISNLNTIGVFNMTGIFSNCQKLSSIKISNFATSKVIDMSEIFYNCFSLTSLDLSNFDTSKVINFSYIFFNCSSLNYLNISNFNTKSVKNMEGMFANCESLTSLYLYNFNTSQTENMNSMFYECKNLTELNLSNFDFTSINDLRNMFYGCENLQYINLNSYNELQHLVMDNILYLVPENIIICLNKDNNIYQIMQKVIENPCYNIYCGDDWKSNYYEQNNKSYLNLTTEEENEKMYQGIINYILPNFLKSGDEELIIEGKGGFFFHISNIENNLDFLDEKSNKSSKFSKIFIGKKCEDEIKDYYVVGRNVSLITMVYEKISDVSSERNTQYEIYETLSFKKLNISVCGNALIDIYFPLTLTQNFQNLFDQVHKLGYDLFDINNKFYQDICTPYKSPNKTDVLLADRIYYYYNNNETKCQANCQFSYYIIKTNYLKCQCDNSNSEINTNDITKFEPKIIYKSFYDVLKFSNYKVLKCYKLVFVLDNIRNNMGSLIILIFIFIYLIVFILYLIKGKKEIYFNLIKIKKERFVKNLKTNKALNQVNKIKLTNKNKFVIKNIEFPPKKNIIVFNSNKKISIGNKKIINIYSKNIANSNSKIQLRESYNDFKNKNGEKLDSYELNNLDFKKAIKLDKRKFWEIYWSILNREHLIISTFFNRNDYNIIYIKLSGFIFLICTDMASNVFFFADETMHKMFLDYGKYNFIQQIPQIIYSTLVSKIIQSFLSFFSLSDKHYYEIKMSQKILEKRVIKCIKLKFALFFIYTFIIFIFYWYTISSFCTVYTNTQVAFLKNSITSFFLGLLYSFILIFLSALLRFISLKFYKKGLSWIYAISNIILLF